MPLTKTPNCTKHAWICLTKEGQDVYNEVEKTVKSKVTKDENKWRDIPRPSIGRLSAVMISFLPRIINR